MYHLCVFRSRFIDIDSWKFAFAPFKLTIMLWFFFLCHDRFYLPGAVAH